MRRRSQAELKKKKVDFLVNNIPNLIRSFNDWGYRQGPSLYFYKKIMAEIKENKLRSLLENKKFIELIYATLVSWDMNSRGAKIKYFDDFFENIRGNKRKFLQLSNLKLYEISDIEKVKSNIEDLYSKLNFMISNARLVANSKLMHFILPDLVMPMDRTNTLMFFYGNTNESKNKFLRIFECSWHVAKDTDLSKYLDSEWNQTIPKIIDNAIMGKRYKDKNH